uniref:Chromo domain-containing protein n=1 Tax=Globodera pallida TaxID=36090 RepID=A0A183BMY6_GLOPA
MSELGKQQKQHWHFVETENAATIVIATLILLAFVKLWRHLKRSQAVIVSPIATIAAGFVETERPNNVGGCVPSLRERHPKTRSTAPRLLAASKQKEMKQWTEGQKIRCLWKSSEYAAKIMAKWEEAGRLFYRVHYIGWNSRMDETVCQTEAQCRFRDWAVSELPPGVFTIEKICEKRERKKRKGVDVTEYRVRWEGYGSADDTWEPEQKLMSDGCDWSIEQFEGKSKSSRQPKKRKNKS